MRNPRLVKKPDDLGSGCGIRVELEPFASFDDTRFDRLENFSCRSKNFQVRALSVDVQHVDRFHVQVRAERLQGAN